MNLRFEKRKALVKEQRMSTIRWFNTKLKKHHLRRHLSVNGKPACSEKPRTTEGYWDNCSSDRITCPYCKKIAAKQQPDLATDKFGFRTSLLIAHPQETSVEGSLEAQYGLYLARVDNALNVMTFSEFIDAFTRVELAMPMQNEEPISTDWRWLL